MQPGGGFIGDRHLVRKDYASGYGYLPEVQVQRYVQEETQEQY